MVNKMKTQTPVGVKNMAINYIKPYAIYIYFIKLVSALLQEI